MAKRTRAAARQSRKRKSPSTKVRKANIERTKKAVEARRCKFSPSLVLPAPRPPSTGDALPARQGQTRRSADAGAGGSDVRLRHQRTFIGGIARSSRRACMGRHGPHEARHRAADHGPLAAGRPNQGGSMP